MQLRERRERQSETETERDKGKEGGRKEGRWEYGSLY